MNTMKSTSKNEMVEPDYIMVKPYMLKELAHMYKVCERTFRKWLKPFEAEIGQRRGNYYTIPQVEMIFEKIGLPFTQAAPKVAVHDKSIDFYTEATWNFAHSILWNNQSFKEIEEELSKEYIRVYYALIPAKQFAEKAKRLFKEYCERVLLARLYTDRFASRFIPHPCIWLNKSYAKGFAGTREWHEKVKITRLALPEYLSGIRQVAELYEEYTCNSSVAVFGKAVKAFSEKEESKLLKLFCNSIQNYSSNKQISLTA